jgi:hypothetical protein
MNRSCSCDGALGILFFFKGYPLGFLKKSFAAIEPKLLVMWEKIGGSLKMGHSAYQLVETWYYHL